MGSNNSKASSIPTSSSNPEDTVPTLAAPSVASMHVANGSSMSIRARIAQEEIQLKEYESSHKAGVSGGASAEFGVKFLTKATAEAKGNYDYDLKRKWEGIFMSVGFAIIEPQDALEFSLYSGADKKTYVSVWIEDDKHPEGFRLICDNIVAMANRSILVGNKSFHYSQLKKPFKGLLTYDTDSGNIAGGAAVKTNIEIPTWVTDEGICYSADLVKRVFRQEDVDKAAARYRNEKRGIYCTDSALDAEKELEDERKEVDLVKVKDWRRETPGLKVRPVQDCLYAMDGGSVRKVRALNMQRDSVGGSSDTDIEFGMKRTRISNNEMEIVISVKKQAK